MPTDDPDQTLFRSPLVTVGRFRCPASHRRFRDSGPIRQSCIVFPRTAVAIAHEARRPFVADPSVVTMYNTGDRYERRAISPDGDRCDWYAVSTDVLRDVVRPFDPEAADDPVRLIRHPQARSDNAMYLRQRRLFDELARPTSIESLEVEETVIDIVGRAIVGAYDRAPAVDPASGRAARQRVDLVHAARTILARSFRGPIHLSGLARALDCSPFHLCRSFRRVTGSTLHAHLTTLRLRASLERMSGGVDLTTVALDTGFSSHSHFTAAFHHAFGVTPSRA